MRKIGSSLIVLFMAIILIACKDGGDDNTLTFWAYEPQSLADRNAYNALIDQFEEENDVTIRVSWIPKDSYNQRLNTAVANRRNPDVAYLDQPLIAAFHDENLLVNLTEYITESEVVALSDYFAAALDTTEFGNQYYGLPLTISTTVVLYNQSYINQADIDSIVSWDAWYQVANARKTSSVAAFEGIGAGGYAGWYFGGFIKTAGGDLMNAALIETTFNSAEGVAAVWFLRDLYAISPSSIINSQSAFGNGNALFKLGGGSDIDSLRTNFPSLNFGAILMPPRFEGDASYSNIGGDNIVIFNSARNQDLAFRFIEFLSNNENALKIAEYTGNFPARQSTIGNYYDEDLHRQVLLEQLESLSVRPKVPKWLEVNDRALGAALEAILSTPSINIQTRLDQAKAEADAILNN